MNSAVPISSLADFIGDAVEPAAFPKHIERYWNERWASEVGLGHLDRAQRTAHFGRFTALPGNLPKPLALRYHGHQFGVYNPQLGDGRGFLFAQLRDQAGRLLDLGTKGSGQTPWSRQGDGRLTLKGGVREVLAALYLEALGVNTSKPFSLIETGEQLARNDEPSPTRSAVFTRLSHSHIRFGTFQRLAYLDYPKQLARLVEYSARQYYPDTLSDTITRTTTGLLEQIARMTGRMIGQWMATGFVHGVMNTDNFNITGETFDFGPWRFLPKSDPNFIAAYFDQKGLYRFGRQPVQGAWALQQLASALLPLADADALAASLQAYQPAYQESFIAHTHALLGLHATGSTADDLAFLQTLYDWLTQSSADWPQFFFDWFCGHDSRERAAASPQADLYSKDNFQNVRQYLYERTPERAFRLNSDYFKQAAPVKLLIEDVEAVWAPIANSDDWSAFEAKLAHIEEARQSLALILP